MIRRIPTTDPARTLIDLASLVDEETLEIALDDALRRLISLPRLRWRIRTFGVNGKRGAARLSALLEERGPASRVVESALETLFLRLIKQSGLPLPEKQFEIRDNGRFVARVDFAYPDRKLVIEVDGFSSHSSRLAWDYDRERRNWIEALGWRVLNVTKTQIRSGSASLVERISKMLL